jgi:hypothetical protein
LPLRVRLSRIKPEPEKWFSLGLSESEMKWILAQARGKEQVSNEVIKRPRSPFVVS